MGARVKTIPDEMLIASGVHDLDPELLITTAQAAMLLGCAMSGMAERKRSGRPPAPRQPNGRGTKVSYVLGEVLSARRSAPALSNDAAKKVQQDHVRGFSTFAAFLAEGQLSSQWPFAIINGRPVDFISSLTLTLDETVNCRWLTMGQYMDQVKCAAAFEESFCIEEALKARTKSVIGSRKGSRI